MRAKDGLGAYGEQVAAAHLVAAGMTVLDRNWRCPQGEIDIVARDGDVLVVCEVKTRSSTALGPPAGGRDRAQGGAAAAAGRGAGSRPAGCIRAEVRIDVVGVLRPARGAAGVEHVRGVV